MCETLCKLLGQAWVSPTYAWSTWTMFVCLYVYIPVCIRLTVNTLSWFASSVKSNLNHIPCVSCTLVGQSSYLYDDCNNDGNHSWMYFFNGNSDGGYFMTARVLSVHQWPAMGTSELHIPKVSDDNRRTRDFSEALPEAYNSHSSPPSQTEWRMTIAGSTEPPNELSTGFFVVV